MIYLQYEEKLFQRVKERFVDYYDEAIQTAEDRFKQRGELVDLGSPIHHRVSAVAMSYEIAKKCRRIDAAQTREGWHRAPKMLTKIIEECTDIINYAAFLSAFCQMLNAEMEQDDEISPDSST